MFEWPTSINGGRQKNDREQSNLEVPFQCCHSDPCWHNRAPSLKASALVSFPPSPHPRFIPHDISGPPHPSLGPALFPCKLLSPWQLAKEVITQVILVADDEGLAQVQVLFIRGAAAFTGSCMFVLRAQPLSAAHHPLEMSLFFFPHHSLPDMLQLLSTTCFASYINLSFIPSVPDLFSSCMRSYWSHGVGGSMWRSHVKLAVAFPKGRVCFTALHN